MQYLRPSKRQKALRWNPEDEEKFYDSLKIFGENCDMIHSVIFCPEKAKARYENPEDFSERSIVQLKNKFKKEQNKIYKIIDNKKPSETVAWFE